MRQRLSDNSVLQLMLGAHLALLVLLAGVHRLLSDGYYSITTSYRMALAVVGGVFVAQVALVACWAAFSRSHSALRIGALVLFVPFLAMVQSQVFSETDVFVWWGADRQDTLMRYTIWAEELGLFAIGVAMLGVGMRRAGCRLESPHSPAVDFGGWRFRLIDLVYWSVLAGLILGAVRWLGEYGWTWRRAALVAEWGVGGGWIPQVELAISGVAIAMAVLGLGSRRWTIVVLIFTPLLLSFVNEYGLKRFLSISPSVDFVYGPLYSQDFSAVLHYVFGLVFGGTLLVLRDRGYRLIWRNPWNSNRQPDARAEGLGE